MAAESDNFQRRTAAAAPMVSPNPSGTSGLRPPYPPQTRFLPTGSPASPAPYYSPTHSGMSSPRPHSPDYRNGCLAHVRMTAMAKCSRYFRRLINYRHMDFEFACWQMIYLLVTPQKVYRNFMYRKRTKDQWARDDPAFLVLLSATLALSSILFAVILGLSFVGFLKFTLWVIFVDFIGVGVIIASCMWLVSNQVLRVTKDQDVEWGYCWDVHLNAFFPLLVTLHIVMAVLYPVIIGRGWFISCLIGNCLWFIAIAYYIYITFLGYTALGNLKGTQAILYPITFIFIGVVAITTLGWNISSSIMDFYHFRVT